MSYQHSAEINRTCANLGKCQCLGSRQVWVLGRAGGLRRSGRLGDTPNCTVQCPPPGLLRVLTQPVHDTAHPSPPAPEAQFTLSGQKYVHQHHSLPSIPLSPSIFTKGRYTRRPRARPRARARTEDRVQAQPHSNALPLRQRHGKSGL